MARAGSTRPPPLRAEASSARAVASDLMAPNGMAIAPDGRTLIVAETLAMRLTAFDIAADGTLSNRRVWAKLGMRAPDGICLDANGHVWFANAIAPECLLVAPGGDVVFATLNRNPKSFLFAIVGAEVLLRLVKRGTHSYRRFVKPAELRHWARG